MQLHKGRVIDCDLFRSANGQEYFNVRLKDGSNIICTLEQWLFQFLMSALHIKRPKYLVISNFMAQSLKKRGLFVIIH